VEDDKAATSGGASCKPKSSPMPIGRSGGADTSDTTTTARQPAGKTTGARATSSGDNLESSSVEVISALDEEDEAKFQQSLASFY